MSPRHRAEAELAASQRDWARVRAICLASLKDSETPEAFTWLGRAEMIFGRHDAAEQAFRSALEKDSRCFDALLHGSNALRSSGKLTASLEFAERAIALAPDHPLALNSAALALIHLSRPRQAISYLDRALLHAPEVFALYRHKGMALQLLQCHDEARDFYQRALSLQPNDIASLHKLAGVHHLLGYFEEVLQCVDRIVRLNPRDPVAYVMRAQALALLNRNEEAEAAYRKSIELDPASRLVFGEWLIQERRQDEAREVFAASAADDPNDGIARFHLAALDRYEVDEEAFRRLREIAASDSASWSSRAHAEYALGHILETRGEFQSAIECFKRGHVHQPGYALLSEVDVIGKTKADRLQAEADWTREAIARLQAESGGRNLIFVVGMIRSGTTLLEQLLAGSPDVAPCGELQFWTQMASAPLRVLGDPKNLRQSYLDLVRNCSGGRAFSVDKMPLNFRFLGAIHCAFPEATIVHITRDPVDTCLSMFTTRFVQTPLYALRLADVGAFYREYQLLMDHWRKVLPPERLVELRYEDLVASPEERIAEIKRKAGVDTDSSSALRSNTSAIRTPSALQAQQGVYRTSVGRSQGYLPYIQDLLDALRS